VRCSLAALDSEIHYGAIDRHRLIAADIDAERLEDVQVRELLEQIAHLPILHQQREFTVHPRQKLARRNAIRINFEPASGDASGMPNHIGKGWAVEQSA